MASKWQRSQRCQDTPRLWARGAREATDLHVRCDGARGPRLHSNRLPWGCPGAAGPSPLSRAIAGKFPPQTSARAPRTCIFLRPVSSDLHSASPQLRRGDGKEAAVPGRGPGRRGPSASSASWPVAPGSADGRLNPDGQSRPPSPAALPAPPCREGIVFRHENTFHFFYNFRLKRSKCAAI